MKRLKHYIFRYWYLMVFGIVCILGQAAAELALPGYMSTIVTNGIQSGGFTSSVSPVFSQSTYESLLVLSSGQDRQLIKNSYTYEDSLSDHLSSTFPKATHVYVLNDDYDKALEKALVKPLIAVSLMKSKNYTSALMLDETMRNDLLTQVEQQLKDMGASSQKIAVGQVIKNEYESLGANVTAHQTSYILEAGVMMLLIALIGAIASFTGATFASLLGAKVARNIRLDVFKKVESFSEEEMNHFSTASLITRSTNDITQVQQLIIIFIRMICFAPVLGIGALIRALQSSTTMTWIIALALILLLGTMILIMVIALPKFRIVQSLIDRLNLAMRENLNGMLVIRAFSNEQASEDRFDRSNTSLTSVNLFVNRIMVALSPIMILIMNGVSLAIIYVGARQLDLGNVAIGDIMAFLQYAMMIIMGFLMIGMMFVMLPRAEISANRIADVLETKATILDPEEAAEFDEQQKGYVVFDHVTFHYPDSDTPVLKDISFTAKPGEMTAFIGSTGSGKTTLINLIPRFYDVSEGSVFVNGQDVRHVKLQDLREHIGLVPQKSMLLAGTVKSNVTYGSEHVDDATLKQIINVAQASEFIDRLPQGIDAPIAQGGSNVSGGQKQRLAIARALYKQADILIFDDSFSALDFKTDAALRKALMAECEQHNTTVLIVGQRIASIMDASQIMVLDQGEIVGRGTHQELMTSCPVYQEIAYSQLSKEELYHE